MGTENTGETSYILKKSISGECLRKIVRYVKHFKLWIQISERNTMDNQEWEYGWDVGRKKKKKQLMYIQK